MSLTIVTGVQKLGQVLLDLLYPRCCVGCGRPGTLYCAPCMAAVPRISLSCCPLCGKPQASSVLCSRCTEHPLAIDGIRSAARFEGTLQDAIHCLKYKYMRGLAEQLGELMVEAWTRYSLPADLLVPVPLHPRRIRERGYNQSELLALYLGQAIGLPVAYDVLCRSRYTRSQARLNAEERRGNVSGAFICPGKNLCGVRVVLIDDVCTTGATLQSCSMALRAAGAQSVWAFTLARAV